MGSSAGAGSGEFHVYRNDRNKEYARMRYLEHQAREEEEQNAFLERRLQAIQGSTEKTAKKRAKRLVLDAFFLHNAVLR